MSFISAGTHCACYAAAMDQHQVPTLCTLENVIWSTLLHCCEYYNSSTTHWLFEVLSVLLLITIQSGHFPLTVRLNNVFLPVELFLSRCAWGFLHFFFSFFPFRAIPCKRQTVLHRNRRRFMKSQPVTKATAITLFVHFDI